MYYISVNSVTAGDIRTKTFEYNGFSLISDETTGAEAGTQQNMIY